MEQSKSAASTRGLGVADIIKEGVSLVENIQALFYLSGELLFPPKFQALAPHHPVMDVLASRKREPFNQSRVESIDEQGDLHLRVGSSQHIFQVQSRRLCTHSKVFESMLTGGYQESQRPANDDWIVDLPEDSPDALRQIFHVLHGNLAEMRLHTSFDDNTWLYELVVVADKYGLTSILKPWASRWISDCLHQRLCSIWKDCPQEEEWVQKEQAEALFIAWILGSTLLFRSIISHIAKYATISDMAVIEGKVPLIPDIQGMNPQYWYFVLLLI